MSAETKKPALVYCGRCKMSHNPQRHPAGCPYCRTPGFRRRMHEALEAERRERDRREALKEAAARIVVGALSSGLDVAVDADLGTDLDCESFGEPDDG